MRVEKIRKKILTHRNACTVHFDIINSFYAIFIGIYLPSLPLLRDRNPTRGDESSGA